MYTAIAARKREGRKINSRARTRRSVRACEEEEEEERIYLPLTRELERGREREKDIGGYRKNVARVYAMYIKRARERESRES